MQGDFFLYILCQENDLFKKRKKRGPFQGECMAEKKSLQVKRLKKRDLRQRGWTIFGLDPPISSVPTQQKTPTPTTKSETEQTDMRDLSPEGDQFLCSSKMGSKRLLGDSSHDDERWDARLTYKMDSETRSTKYSGYRHTCARKLQWVPSTICFFFFF